MAMNIYRKATQNDVDALNKKALEFVNRHGISTMGVEATRLGYELPAILSYYGESDKSNSSYLMGLWKKIASRALGLPTQGACPFVANGYVGTSAE